jgi:hypothetical protein
MSLAKVTFIKLVQVCRYGLCGCVAAHYIKWCVCVVWQHVISSGVCVVWQHVISSLQRETFVRIMGFLRAKR